MVYTKKQKFAVEVDEFGRTKKHLNRLLTLLKEEYPFLTQANRCASTKRISTARKGEMIIFGSSNKYDFKVVSAEQAEEQYGNYILLELGGEWNQVQKRLDKFAKANYPEEYFIDDDCYCCVPDIVYVDNDRSWEDIFVINTTSSRKKNVVTTRRPKQAKKLVADGISVFHNFVKIGWDVYDIYLTSDGDEYFKVNGNTYWIDRDSHGKGKVSVA